MKLITIFNYPNEEKYNQLCSWWLKQAKKHANMPIHVWHEKDLDESLITEGVVYERKTRQALGFTVPGSFQAKAEHNIGFKLYNLCKETEPFIFVDADAIIFSDLDPLVEASKDKPFICVDHQQVPNHSAVIPYKFLNSGVQIVSDPSFLNYEDIYRTLLEDKRFACPGTDQAMLFGHFKRIGYDYTHKKVGFEWNSCAGYSIVREGELVCEGLDYPHPVYINHYWHEFKPWIMNCYMWNQR